MEGIMATSKTVTTITPENIDSFVFSGTREVVANTRTTKQIEAGVKSGKGHNTNFIFVYDAVPLTTILDNAEKPVIITTRLKFRKEVPAEYTVQYGVKGVRGFISKEAVLDDFISRIQSGKATPEDNERLAKILELNRKNK